METKNLILIDTVCSHHNIEISFVSALREYGLIEVVEMADNQYLSNEQLKDFEKMMRLHYELNINLEGIDVIARLLQRIDDLQQELLAARNKLTLLD
jgi:MerR HTH family regulatory protein